MTTETLLLRQVNPSWIQAKRITSQLFKPTAKDQKGISVYDGDQITPEDSWRYYTGKLGYASVGVMAVTVAECAAQNLPVAPDPEPFPEHVLIKFDGLSNSQIEKKAKRLRAAAVSRGWLYEAEADT